MNRSLIIPSAKNILFLDNDIGEISPVLFPINGRIVFEYIYDKYNKFVNDIKVVTIKDIPLIEKNYCHSDDRIDVVKLDNLKDLGYTIYFGLKSVKNNTCYINFADSILFDEIENYNDNCIFFTEDLPSNDWTYFDCEDGKITSIYDKNLQPNYTTKKKLFVGIFKISDISFFIKCLEKVFINVNEDMDSFYSALLLYNDKYTFDFVAVKDWLDVGHQDKYYNSKLEVCARIFNHMKLDKERGIITKKSDNKTKLIDEINWYLNIPVDIQFLLPRIYSYSTDINDPFVTMEYYSYHTLHELFLYGNLDLAKWKTIFNRLIFILNEFKKYILCPKNIKETLTHMYFDKTIERMEELKNNYFFSYFFSNNFKINGEVYCNILKTLELIKQYICDKLINIDNLNIIHGDFCFSNILIDNNYTFVKLIDPRGKFGIYNIYGDSRYDLAKIFHCLDGKYDYIIKNMFKLSVISEKEFYFSFFLNEQDEHLFDLFLSCINFDYIIDDIYFIEGLLFLSMIPLHSENLQQQYAMLCTSYIILSRLLPIKLG